MKQYDDAKIELILAGESLFAQKGIGAVSAREIAATAGNKNSAAVSYHFKSKEGLIEAIFRYRIFGMDSIRGQMLVDAGTEGKLTNIRRLLEIVCLPHLSIKDSNGKHPYAAFMSRFPTHMMMTRFVLSPGEHSESVVNIRRTMDLIKNCLPHLSNRIVLQRLSSITGLFLDTILAIDNSNVYMPESQSDFIDLINDVMNQTVAALSAPAMTPDSDFSDRVIQAHNL